MTCHSTILVRSYAGGATVVGQCDCGIKTGELVYLLIAHKAATIEAARVILKLLHDTRTQ